MGWLIRHTYKITHPRHPVITEPGKPVKRWPWMFAGNTVIPRFHPRQDERSKTNKMNLEKPEPLGTGWRVMELLGGWGWCVFVCCVCCSRCIFVGWWFFVGIFGVFFFLVGQRKMKPWWWNWSWWRILFGGFWGTNMTKWIEIWKYPPKKERIVLKQSWEKERRDIEVGWK